MLCMLFLVRAENVTNGQTHIGKWVENVTKRQMHSKNGDGRTDGKLFSKEG